MIFSREERSPPPFNTEAALSRIADLFSIETSFGTNAVSLLTASETIAVPAFSFSNPNCLVSIYADFVMLCSSVILPELLAISNLFLSIPKLVPAFENFW